MNKRCAKCEKTVYPTEELKCLDKSWHKGCFKCAVCNMTLNMKNYKGYDKVPYCNAHYPKMTPIEVADTPESRRIAENTKIQSNLEYHKEFEQCKDQFTTVADTVEMRTLRKNSKNFSLLEYHKEFEQCKDQFTTVADTVEMRTLRKNSKNFSLLEYHTDFEKSRGKITTVADPLELAQHLRNTENVSSISYKSDYEKSKSDIHTVADDITTKRVLKNTENSSMVKYHAEFEKMKGKKITVADDPDTLRVKHNTEIQSNISYHGVKDQRQEQEQRRPAEQVEAGRVRTNPGRISDYAPPEEQPPAPAQTGGTPYSSRNSAGARQIYDSNIGKDPSRALAYQAQRYHNNEDVSRRGQRSSIKNRVERFSSGDDDSRYSPSRHSRGSYTASPPQQPPMEHPQPRHVGSIADYDPMNEQYGSIGGKGRGQAAQQPVQQPQQPYSPPKQPQQPAYQPPPPQYNPPPQQPRDPYAGKGTVTRAIYDYQAGDSDEVSFNEGDIIIHCDPIDDGWMVGVVEKDGSKGMLPSNYVERVN